MSRIVVFVGPSLVGEDPRAYCPEAEIRAPIRRGELAEFHAPDRVGIIDGVFSQDLAVAPREVHEAVERGVRVWGSSSMGALRAAEVPGMLGLGKIYEWYRDGRVERDDEVALVFDAETYRNFSVPLVNLRYSIERLERSGSISARLAASLLRAARALPFADRRLPDVVRAAGVDDELVARQLYALLAAHDLKREDALLLLETLQHSLATPEGTALPMPPRKQAMSGTPVPPASTPYVWEYGDALSFEDVVDFLKCTGEFTRTAWHAATQVLLRRPTLYGELPAEPSAELRKLRLSWGWLAAEEVRVTLADLGVGVELLNSALSAESKIQAAIRHLAAASDPEFLDALRAELLQDDLGLKRAVLRAGSLARLARQGRALGAAISIAERRDARARMRRAMAAWTDAEASTELAGLGMTEQSVEAIVDQIIFARRAMHHVLGAPRLVKKRSPGTWRIPESLLAAPRRRLKATGSDRFHLGVAAGARLAKALAASVGVTRIGFIGELDEAGVHISQAFRPSSTWSTTTGSGKGMTRDAAMVGGVLEEAERFAQERFAPTEAERLRGSFTALRSRGRSLVDPLDLDLPADSRYDPRRSVEWMPCADLVTRKVVYAPCAAFVHARLVDDPFYSERAGQKLFSTNGLASGFCPEEALVHGICEVVERHATRLAELKTENPGLTVLERPHFIDPSTLPPALRRIVDRMTRSGYELRLLDITSEIRIPTFDVRLFRPDADHKSFVGLGWATHPDPAVALRMALFEAAQGRAVQIGGAREDLDLYARSLGRHERPRPERSQAIALHYGSPAAARPFDKGAGLCTRDLRQELDWVVERVVEAGFPRILVRDLSCAEVRPASVVRVVIPGTETPNPFYTGPRARLSSLTDLLDPPLWFSAPTA